MNTKKITALALAALMAAGTTVPAFAADISTDKDEALVFDGAAAYEENDDGLLVLDDGVVNPGDSLYFLLKDGSYTGITDKERDRINVYADWKLGKEYIEDIDVIYKKGNSKVTGYTYTVSGTGYFSTAKTFDIPGTKLTSGTEVGNKLPADVLAAALESEYTNPTSGFVYNNKYYADTKEGLEALLTDHADWAVGTGTANATVNDSETNGLGSYTASGVHNQEDYFVNSTKSLCIDTETVGTITKLLALDDTDTEFAAASGGAYTFTGVEPVDADDYVAGKAPANSDAVVTKTAAEATIKGTVSTIDKTVEIRNSSSYTYWVEVKTKDDITTKELDLAGTLYLGTTKNSAEKNGTRLPVDMSLTNRLYDSSKNFLSVEDEVTIDPDANGAVKFDPDAEEVTIYFGENEDAWFTFNAQGQGALNLAYTTKFNKEIADLFPKTNIDFITWTATPATNRTGDLYITADEDTFLYEVTEDGIKEVNGAKYDEDEGAWHIRTRKLASYVISDMELDTSVKLDNDSSSSTSSGSNTDADGNKANPDTGR